MDNNSNKFVPALYDKMIDDAKYNTNNKFTKIVTNHHNKISKQATHSECILRNSFLGECTHLINAHSIHNNGILDKLSENNFVIALDNLKDNNIEYRNLLVGKNEATIFRGFCKKHDEIFRSIEDLEYGNNKLEQNYLFAYRAFCKRYIDSITSYNYYKRFYTDFIDSEQLEKTLEKHKDVPIFSKEIRENKKKIVKKRQDLRIKELEKLITDNNNLRIIFNKNLEKARYSKIQTLELEFEVKNVLACSSMVDLATDFEGKLFNKDLKYPIFLTVFPNGNTTKILISYLKIHSTFLQNIILTIKNSKVEIQELFISNIMIKKANNIIFNPIEFRKFSKSSIDILSKEQLKRTQHPRDPLATYNLNIFRPH